ncbi:hypothetical protein OB13_19385 [Pontibacter sp. HJ8]
MKAIAESGDADTTEMQLIALSMMSSALGGEKLDGKTYKQIIDEAKEIQRKAQEEEKKQALLAAEAQQEEQQRIERLNKALTVTVFDKGFEEYSYQEYITYKFAFQNNGDKDIRAFKGRVSFTDLFDTEIKSFNMTYDEGLLSGKKMSYEATTDYNQFMDEDKRLVSKDLKDLKMVWKPEQILFTDGTVLK